MALVSHHIVHVQSARTLKYFCLHHAPQSFSPTSVLIRTSLAFYSGCACAVHPCWLSRKLEEIIKLTNKVC